MGESLYYHDLIRYLEVPPRNNQDLYFRENGIRRGRFLQGHFQFLGVDNEFPPDLSIHYNRASNAKRNALQRVLNGNKRLKRTARKYLPPKAVMRISDWQHKIINKDIERPSSLTKEERLELTEQYFAKEISMLESLIGKDLSLWRD